MYWDRQGNPITDGLEWGRLHTPEYKRVAQTTIGPVWISTVWVGLDMGFLRPDSPPLIFETMVFVRPDAGPVHPELANWDQMCWRWATEAEAAEGHDQVCVDVRVLLEQIKMADDVLNEAIERVKGT
jgi:hypothetical protein